MNQILAVGRQYLVGLALPLSLFMTGCGRDEVRVYDVPKEPSPHAAMQNPHGGMPSPHGAMSPHGMGSLAGQPHIHFDRPEGWVQQPPSQLRVASFRVPGTDGLDADVSVIPLAGVSGQDVQVMNLWREQLQLAPLKQEELEGMGTEVTVGGEPARLFDLVSEEPLPQLKGKAQILVAMLDLDGTGWFFKMTGPESLVSQQRDEFDAFLKSVTFATDSHDDAPMAGMAQMGAPAMGGAAGANLPEWDVPDDWKQVPSPSMIVAKFTAGGAGNDAAEITVSSFPGDVGGLEANVNRWRSQIGLQGVSGDELQKLLSPLELSDGTATLVDMAGTSMDNGEPARLVAATVPRGDETWFFKMLGPVSVVGAEKEAFTQFVKSVRY